MSTVAKAGRVWIKICANTTLEDAQLAIDLGADAVGFVFAPSARRVTPNEAGAITARLTGEAEWIGVFPAVGHAEVRDAVRVAGLSGVQLHGEYDRGLVYELREEFGDEVTIAQTLHCDVDGRSFAPRLSEQIREIEEENLVDRLLLDAKVGGMLGGTGRVFDWDAARQLFDQAGIAMIVAGGLKPDNIQEAIDRLHPWGVDIASGVESVPGRKDRERVKLFVENVRRAGDATHL